MNGNSWVLLNVPETDRRTHRKACNAGGPWTGVQRRTLAVATLALAVLLVAGCFGGPAQTSSSGSTGTSTTTATTTATTTNPPTGTFDGEAALEFVKGFALREDGSPRFRMPGTVGQTEGAAYLWEAMDVPGWTRGWQNFTGADYRRLDRTPVDSYARPPSCSQADYDRVPTYPFHNLYATRSGGDPDQPLVLLVAHWDSLQRSFMDPDPEKKDDPYPGANDGASGVGLLLRLMRQLDGIALPFGVGVLFVDGEDGFIACYPLAGSLQFAQHPPLDPDRVLVLDMVGDPGARFIRDSASVQSDPVLVDLLWRHGHAFGGGESFPNTASSVTDDHLAFIHSGIPAVDLVDYGRGFPPTWHTTSDTVDRLSPAMLALVGDVLLATLQDPQFHASWPE